MRLESDRRLLCFLPSQAVLQSQPVFRYNFAHWCSGVSGLGCVHPWGSHTQPPVMGLSRLFVEISPCFSSCCHVSSVGQADIFRKWCSFHRRKSCHWLLETSFMLTSQELAKLPAFLFHPGHCSLCRSMPIGLQIWSRRALSISIKQSNTRKKTSLVYMWAGRKQTYH